MRGISTAANQGQLFQRLKMSCCLQRDSDKLEREVREWTDSKLDAALYERHNKGKAMEARAKQQLTSAGRNITKGWTPDQCIGRAAVLVMSKLIFFNEQALGLTYGLLDSDHFKLQHEAAIDKLVLASVEEAGAAKVQLAVMFKGLVEKQPDLTSLADAEYKSLKHDKEQEAQRAENREIMNKLVAHSASRQQQQQQQHRASPVVRPPRGSVGGCR